MTENLIFVPQTPRQDWRRFLEARLTSIRARESNSGGTQQAHTGRRKTAQKLREHFFWPGLNKDVREACRSCGQCQKAARVDRQKAPLMPLPVFDRITMDIVGPLQRSHLGNKYVLTLMDYATKYPEAIPLKRIDTKTVADALVQVFARLGIPHELLTDQGSNFTSGLMKELLRMLGIKHLKTSPYHPQSDGMVERFNGTLKTMLRKNCDDPKDCYCEAPHSTTGFSPFELLYGRHVRGPLDVMREEWVAKTTAPQSVVSYVLEMRDRLDQMGTIASTAEETTKIKIKVWYDRDARSRSFAEGDQVLVLLPVGCLPSGRDLEAGLSSVLLHRHARQEETSTPVPCEHVERMAHPSSCRAMTDPQQSDCDDIDFATVASDAGHAEIGKQLTPQQRDELDQLLTDRSSACTQDAQKRLNTTLRLEMSLHLDLLHIGYQKHGKRRFEKS